MRRTIRWENWKYPLGGGPEYVPEDDADPQFEAEGNLQTVTPARPVVPTPDGFMPVFVYKQNEFFNNFRFWMMHTDFPITEEMKEELDYFPGIEMFDVVTKYRARVGIGKCFDPEQVKLGIEEFLGVRRPKKITNQITIDPETGQKVEILKRMAGENYPYWMIYIVPNGELSLVHTDSGPDYENYLDLMKQTQELAGGMLIVSHE